MSQEFNPKAPSQGLGDTIAKITHAVGLDKVAEAVANAVGAEDCGCNKRRELLNNLVPYQAKPQTTALQEQETGLYTVLASIVVNKDGKEYRYAAGDKVMVLENNPLYPFLTSLIRDNKISFDATNRTADSGTPDNTSELS